MFEDIAMNYKKQTMIMMLAGMIYTTHFAMQDLMDILITQKCQEHTQVHQSKSQSNDIPEEIKEKLYPHLYYLPSRAEVFLARRQRALPLFMCFGVVSCLTSHDS